MRELLVIPVHPVRISCSNFVKLEMEVIEASVSCSSSAKYKCFNSFMWEVIYNSPKSVT